MLIAKTLQRVTFVAALMFLVAGCAEKSNREDFQSLIKDKTEADVLKFAGKPENVDQSNPDKVTWIYKARTFDVQTRNTDAETDVIFALAPDGTRHVAQVVFK